MLEAFKSCSYTRGFIKSSANSRSPTNLLATSKSVAVGAQMHFRRMKYGLKGDSPLMVATVEPGKRIGS